MTSLERVVATLRHQPADRVPVFLPLTMHGAKELGLGLRDYFDTPAHVVEGQLRLRRKYGHDCLYALRFAAADFAAFGGEVLFADDGPANAGAPVIRTRQDIFALQVPRIAEAAELQKSLQVVAGLAAAARGEVPVVGVVIGAFSLPIMLMGFDAYLEMLHRDPEAADRLLAVTQAFATEWALAQYAAGATAVVYFDPMASSDMSSKPLYRRWGAPTLEAVAKKMPGPMALHLASSRTLPRLSELTDHGFALISTSGLDDLSVVRQRCHGHTPVIGNLNGIQLAGFTRQETEAYVDAALDRWGHAGGLILSDHHGEFPLQVPDENVLAVVETAHAWSQRAHAA